MLSPIAVVDAEAPYQRRDDENVKKTIGLTSTPTICTCITLFRTFLRRFCTTTTSKYLILRFMENVNKQRLKGKNFVSLFLEMVPSFNKVSARCRRVVGSLKKALIIDLT